MTIHWVVVGVVAIYGCGGDLDCRRKAKECASGFVCEECAGGKWDCLKSEKAVAVELDAREGEASSPGEGRPKPHYSRGPKVETKPCKDHRRCKAASVDCLCNQKGQLVVQILDRDGDGKGDEKAEYQYNQEDFLTFVIVDEGMDGTDDLRHEYGYRAKDVPMFWEITKAPGSSNTKPESRLNYVYDTDGNLVVEDMDLGLDGTIDKRCIYAPPCPPPFPNPSCKPVCKDVEIRPQDLEMNEEEDGKGPEPSR